MNKTKINKSNLAQLKFFVEKNAPKSSELRYGSEENELVVKVYPIIPFTKRIEMIKEIIDSVFMGKKNTIQTYAPEFLALVKKYAIIKYYTDLTLPSKLDDMWFVLNFTTIYQDVIEIVGKKEIDDIFKAADEGIDANKQYLIAKTDTNNCLDKITNWINNIKSSFSKESIINALNALDELPQGAELREIANKFLGNKN